MPAIFPFLCQNCFAFTVSRTFSKKGVAAIVVNKIPAIAASSGNINKPIDVPINDRQAPNKSA